MGLRRLFDPGELEWLALTALGRAAGFSLGEIALMFTADGRPNIDRQMLADKAEELDRAIRKLNAMPTACATPPTAPRPATWNATASCGLPGLELSVCGGGGLRSCSGTIYPAVDNCRVMDVVELAWLYRHMLYAYSI